MAHEQGTLQAWTEDVRPEWIDYNGHLSEAYYVLVFGHATDAVMSQLGMTPAYLAATGTSLYTLEAHVRYVDQVPPEARLDVRPSVIGVTGKLLWLWHEMWSDGPAAGHRGGSGRARRCPGRAFQPVPRRAAAPGRGAAGTGTRTRLAADRAGVSAGAPGVVRRAAGRDGDDEGVRAARADAARGRGGADAGGSTPSWSGSCAAGRSGPGCTRRTCPRRSAAAGWTR